MGGGLWPQGRAEAQDVGSSSLSPRDPPPRRRKQLSRGEEGQGREEVSED